jgi:hypothetical protein
VHEGRDLTLISDFSLAVSSVPNLRPQIEFSHFQKDSNLQYFYGATMGKSPLDLCAMGGCASNQSSLVLASFSMDWISPRADTGAHSAWQQ